MEGKPTFEQLPIAVAHLMKEIREIKQMLFELNTGSSNRHASEWMTLDELLDYDPEKRKKSTWYKMVSESRVPHHKKGKRLLFLKTEIDEWLLEGKVNTLEECLDSANDYLKKKA
ncbi:helix-turn-helix domain-containing protein [Muricauda sp. CAU 1633]|uniref:helix-turn-helix domain-containing protein n=1 Tax=Allomuricauda sp. CAU 1633 TaxID=2816036 RepID=UPI001A8C23DB|nr:helix-turn-helix domain-containing protein [Muricauda sp. CAU 1633]MBO0324056.1 helix-turn-helix domain-containing protein [Muricauda sp. CAU 1633]